MEEFINIIGIRHIENKWQDNRQNKPCKNDIQFILNTITKSQMLPI